MTFTYNPSGAANVAYNPFVQRNCADRYIHRSCTDGDGTTALIELALSEPDRWIRELCAAARTAANTDRCAANVLVSVAVIAYRLGNWSILLGALDRLRTIEPENVMGQMLETAFHNGVEPQQMQRLAG